MAAFIGVWPLTPRVLPGVKMPLWTLPVSKFMRVQPPKIDSFECRCHGEPREEGMIMTLGKDMFVVDLISALIAKK